MKLLRTNSNDTDFKELVKHLDAYLTDVDGDDHAFYDQFNKLNDLNHVVIAYEDDKAMGCGAFREFDPHTVEVKRMYTSPEGRGKGIATMVLRELEKWAGELSFKKCILETGKRQPEAISLYQKNRYSIIPNYGQYADMENSVCFEKAL